MKRILLYLLLLPSYLSLAQTQIGVAIHDTTLVAGAPVYIPVFVDSSLTGLNVSSFDFEFAFDDYYISVDSLITKGTMTEGWGSISFNKQQGKFRVAGASSTNLSGKGKLFYLKVELLRGGYTAIGFSNNGNNRFNEGSPGVILQEGYLSIYPLPSISVSPNKGEIAVGETIRFYVYDAKLPVVWSVTDPSVASIDADGILTGLAHGKTKVVCQDSLGIVDTTDSYVYVRAFRLSMPDTSYYQGHYVELPIYTTDLSGLGIYSGEITLRVDGSYLTPVKILTAGTCTENCSQPQFSFNNDELKIGFAGTNPLGAGKVLLKVKLKISPDKHGSTFLFFKDIVFNETLVGIGTEGRFTVLPLPSLNVSPSTANLLAGETQTFTATGGTTPYTWGVTDSNLASINSSGVLTAIKGGVVQVTVKDVYGGSGNSGNIYLYDTKVNFPDTTLSGNGYIEIPLYMGNLLSSYSVSSMQGEVEFDSSVVHFADIVTSGTLTNGWSFSVNNNGNKIKFAGAGSVGFNNAGAVFKIKFLVPSYVNNGAYSNLKINDFMFNEGSPNAMLENGVIRISKTNPPLPPSNLSATALDSCSIELVWTDNSSNETGFKVERKQGYGGSWAEMFSLIENTVSFTDTGLVDGMLYYYRVNAFNSYGSSAYSNTDSAITTMNRPRNLTAQNTGGVNVLLNWHDFSNSEEGFVIERAQGSVGGSLAFTVLDTTNANVLSYTDTTITGDGSYVYCVKAFNQYTQSAYSNYAQVIISDVKQKEIVPKDYKVFQNYPNPFSKSSKGSASTTVRFSIPEASNVTVKVYNLLGKEVKNLISKRFASGNYSLTWNANNVPSGVYLIYFSFESAVTRKVRTFTKKAVLIK